VTGTLLNSLIVFGWILWGLSFSEPFHATAPMPPVDLLTLTMQAGVGIATPVLVCWWYARRRPDVMWLKPRVSMNPLATLRGNDPTWIFFLSLWFFVMGTSCATFTMLRGSPFTSFQAMYLTAGLALAVGSLVAWRIFRRHFGA
jgi:hypothetical protein